MSRNDNIINNNTLILIPIHIILYYNDRHTLVADVKYNIL